MSDDDFMQASDEEYDFEYEDEEDDDSGDADIENKYYNAKQLKVSDPEEAVQEFLAIQPLEPEKGEWGFKGLKQAIKLEFKMQRYQKVLSPGKQQSTITIPRSNKPSRPQNITKSSSHM